MKAETSVRHPKEEMETKMLGTIQYSSEQSNFYNIAVDYNKESFSNQVYFFLMNIYSSPQDFSALSFSQKSFQKRCRKQHWSLFKTNFDTANFVLLQYSLLAQTI